MSKKTTEEPIELGGVVALGTSQEVQALDLRLEMLVFCGVSKLRHLVCGDGNAENVMHEEIAFFIFCVLNSCLIVMCRTTRNIPLSINVIN